MAAISIQDIKDFHQIIRLLEEHPEWRADLRRVLLTDDLLTLPAQMARLTEQVTILTERVSTLADGQRRLIDEVGMLTERVMTLSNGQWRLINDVGMLKGRDLERTYREKADIFFDGIIEGPHTVPDAELRPLLDEAVQKKVLSPEERRDVRRADLIVRGKGLQSGENIFLVVEVSWSIYPTDVERAAKRAALLRRLGLHVLAVVAGEGITPEAHQEAVDKEV
jgi:hypothetical protein